MRHGQLEQNAGSETADEEGFSSGMPGYADDGGAYRDRTGDLNTASVALSQLS